METAPRNCRFLSLVVVGLVLTAGPTESLENKGETRTLKTAIVSLQGSSRNNKDHCSAKYINFIPPPRTQRIETQNPEIGMDREIQGSRGTQTKWCKEVWEIWFAEPILV